MVKLKTFPERKFVYLITFLMKTALYEKKFKKTRNCSKFFQRKLLSLIKYNFSFFVFTQWSIRFASLYNVTLFLPVSMIFQNFLRNSL